MCVEEALRGRKRTSPVTYFSCPLCGCRDLKVKHNLDTRELGHLFEVYCHSAFLMQCCKTPDHLFLIAFGENGMSQNGLKVLVPGEW